MSELDLTPREREMRRRRRAELVASQVEPIEFGSQMVRFPNKSDAEIRIDVVEFVEAVLPQIKPGEQVVIERRDDNITPWVVTSPRPAALQRRHKSEHG